MIFDLLPRMTYIIYNEKEFGLSSLSDNCVLNRSLYRQKIHFERAKQLFTDLGLFFASEVGRK